MSHQKGRVFLREKNLQISVSSLTGRVRSINQDNFYYNGVTLPDDSQTDYTAVYEANHAFLAVADGMGGEREGEFASLTAVEALCAIGEELPSYEQLYDCVTKANGIICERSEQIHSCIGTTIVIAVIKGKRLRIYNIGDSKALLYHNGTLTQLSKDHTAAAALVEAGLLTHEEARKDPRSHQLSQHLGIPPEEMQLSLHQQENIPFAKGDVLLLCSDGLTEGLEESEIIRLIEQQPDSPDLASSLTAAALASGSRDNITALTVFQRRTLLW